FGSRDFSSGLRRKKLLLCSAPLCHRESCRLLRSASPFPISPPPLPPLPHRRSHPLSPQCGYIPRGCGSVAGARAGFGMESVSAAAGWTAADDVILKNAVEAGGSLESLAKGAVCFSHKFTLQELQDRWYSLLYDPEASAQASARMANYETELSASNPVKANKVFRSKAKGFSVYKRKIDSVKIQYYAKRKRVCHEPCLSDDFGYVVIPCSCTRKDGGGCACGGQLKLSEDHHLVHKVDPFGGAVSSYGCVGGSDADRQHVHSNGNGQYSFDTEHANSDGSMVIDGNSNHGSLQGYLAVDQLHGYDHMQKNPPTSERNTITTDNRSDLMNQYDTRVIGSKALSSIDQDGIKHDQFGWNSTRGFLQSDSFNITRRGWCSQATSIPTRGKLLGVRSPDTLTDVHRIDQETLKFSDEKMEINNKDAPAFQANLDGEMSVSSLGSVVLSEGKLMHSNLEGFSEKELEVLNNEHVVDSALDKNEEDAGDSHTKGFLKASSRGSHPPSSDIFNCGNHIDPIQKKYNVADVYGVDTVPASSEVLYPRCDVMCILNTEDSEIPSNDHILIPGQSSLEPTSTLNQDSQHYTCLVPTTTTNMEIFQPSPPPLPPIKLEPAIVEQKEIIVNEGSIVGSVPPGMQVDFGGGNANIHTTALHSVDQDEETTCGFFQHEGCDNLQSLTLHKSIQVSDQMNCKPLADEPRLGFEIAIQSRMMSHALPDTEFHNPIASMSTSGQAEESDSENSVPDYFDLEAMILEQDLIPWDEESDFIQSEVSRFQSPESRKDLIKLEKGACSYMNRSIMSNGAFAIIYGRHLRYYIKNPEVTLGRETEEVHVDIDLGKEGKANKISRRQAVIKMDDGGSFYLENFGKSSIFVNSKEVPCNKRIQLISDSLIEIRNLKFIFHVNQRAVKQHIVRAMRGSSQGMSTAFDWNQEP
ncbi:hypothetical protein EJB05_14777, partial [Eragrostis curvula]